MSESQDQKDGNRQICNGMYSRKSWGGNVDPFILVKFSKALSPQSARASLLIFEWSDESLIGVYPESDALWV